MPNGTEYHKIDAPFMRDPKTHRLDIGKWCRQEFEYLADNEWEFTEKVDGTNIRLTFTRSNGFTSFKTQGRTDNAQIPKPLFSVLESIGWGVLDEIDKIMDERDIKELTIYGEGYGPKIQQHGDLYRDTPGFVVFDVKVGGFFLYRQGLEDFCTRAGLDVVPMVGYGTLNDAIQIVSDGLTSRWGDFEAEGIVARPVVPLFNRAGNRIITKIKSKDFK